MSAESGKAHADVNAWFLSLPEGQQAALREDKWMLASAAFDAGKSDPVRAALVDRVNALVEALKMAVRQNSHDMLMTGDELRECNAALRAAGVVL